MASNVKTSAASRNLALNAAFDVLNSGFLDFYTATQPTDVDTAIGAQVKVARLTLGSTACAPASAGSKATNAITSGVGLAAGTATWATFVKSDGTRVHDVSVGKTGTGTFDITIDDPDITVGGTVACAGYTFTLAP